ncbi:MAG: hypothetical protein HOY75_13040 [Streptomyces sp.]|nr:hypothetical protein [Streptomyces sp.]
MSPHSSPSGSVRSAAVVNEDIRALITRTGRRLTDVEKARLEELWVEWVAADRAEVVKAA